MNHLKRTTSFILFLLIVVLSTVSFGAYSNVIMNVVEEPVCTIEFGESSSFEKKLISKNLSNKEVTLQLKATNNEGNSKPSGELMLVIDNSKSMKDIISGTTTREDLVVESAKTLVTNLLTDNTSLKIGVISFSSNVDIAKEGTLEDAALVSDLSSDASALVNKIENIESNGPRTNLDAGITLANQFYTTNSNATNRYMIVLTDGVPNVAIDYDNNYYSDVVINSTKTKLQTISQNVDNLIVMLSGITNGENVATPSDKTYNQIISSILGTPQKPTAGKFYYVTDDKIEQTITKEIYNDLLPVSKSLTDITIVDYFPQEIIDNFEFAHVKKATIGEISAKIDATARSITWTIPELKYGETAIANYTLKLKENYSSNIISKIINTNEKVDLTYKDDDGKKVSKTSDVSPKLKLEEPLTTLPKAGTTIFYVIVIISLVFLIFSTVRWIVLNKKIN